MKHEVDFKQGQLTCRENGNMLLKSGRLLITKNDHLSSYGLFLLYMAYEEYVKSVFCFFIDQKWVSYDFAKEVFSTHESKLFLFDEFFLSFQRVNGETHLGGKKLGEIPLQEFIQNHKITISSHRELTKKFLYVEPIGNNWHAPFTSIKDTKKKQKEIEEKISGMVLILTALEKHKDSPILDGFRFFKDNKGNPTFSFDTL